MSKINYSKNMARTDCNYSFCEQKENVNPNPLEDIARVLNRHYQLHLKNAHTIRQQAAQIHRMQNALTKIQGKLSLSNANPSRMISSISKAESHYKQSIDSFPSSKQRSGSASSKRSVAKNGSARRPKSKVIQCTSHEFSSSSQQNSPGNNCKLLTSIVQRKLNIEKELKERLRNHLLPQSQKAKTQRTNYITYSIER